MCHRLVDTSYVLQSYHRTHLLVPKPTLHEFYYVVLILVHETIFTNSHQLVVVIVDERVHDQGVEFLLSSLVHLGFYFGTAVALPLTSLVWKFEKLTTGMFSEIMTKSDKCGVLYENLND